jgi:hypothetical protein
MSKKKEAKRMRKSGWIRFAEKNENRELIFKFISEFIKDMDKRRVKGNPF